MTLLFGLLRFLPLVVLHGLGALAGWAIFLGSPRYRLQLQANLRRAVGEVAARRLQWQAAAHAGRMALELPAIWCRPLPKVLALVREVVGAEHLAAARKKGALIVITPHLGCFEMVGQYCASFAPLTALYRPPRKEALAPLMVKGRARGMMSLAPADLSGVRALLRALKRGENVGLLPDQAPQFGEGVWAPFFCQPAYTMTLASRLTEVSGVRALLVWAERLPWGRGYRLHFSPLPPLAGDAMARAQALNAALEALILQCPAQYLWGYNRYKTPAGVAKP
jgi:KDO2-lipid IV(A) lauroyltransferase